MKRANTFSKLEDMVQELEDKGYRQVERLYFDEVDNYIRYNNTKVDLDTVVIEYKGNYVGLERQRNDTLNALKHVFG